MADFKVALPNGEVTTYSGEGCRYSIEDRVLTVYDGKGKQLRFSSQWLCIEDAEPKSV